MFSLRFDPGETVKYMHLLLGAKDKRNTHSKSNLKEPIKL